MGLPRLALPLVAVICVFSACGGGGDDNGGDGPVSQTPFIAPSPYTTEVALQKLDEVELLIKVPDPELVSKYNISSTDLEQRIALILSGTSDTTGLDDARAALQADNRILAAEYIHNVVIDCITPAFSGEDSDFIPTQQLDAIDPGGVFSDDHSQGFFTSGVFKKAAIALIELWYRVLPG